MTPREDDFDMSEIFTIQRQRKPRIRYYLLNSAPDLGYYEDPIASKQIEHKKGEKESRSDKAEINGATCFSKIKS